MAIQYVLRVRRTDRASEHLLVHITSNGSRPLDLKLIATDQEHLYHQAIRDNNVKSLQTAQFRGDLQDWISIVSYTLLKQRSKGPLPDLLQGIECVASIEGQTVTLTIRNNVDGITQRLGMITLDQDDEREEVAAFDWVDAAVATSDELRGQLETLQSSVVSQQAQISRLTAQLDDLVKAKQEHEEELLSKFVALINSKKLKIRDQQRLLSRSKVDPLITESVNEARAGEAPSPRKPGVSRKGKRRADAAGEVEQAAPDDENDGSVPDDETDDEIDGETSSRQATPEGSDVEASDREDEDDDGNDNEYNTTSDLPQSSRMEQSGRSVRNGKKPPDSMDIDDNMELPPRRVLPFTRKTPAREPAQSKSTVQAADDEETDDEL